MMNMIEKVARAICVAHSDDPDRFDSAWQELAWVQYEDHAKAALAAIKEPTTKMLEDSGTMTGFDTDGPQAWRTDEHHINWWKSMIEAAEEGA
tara:strand:+ start:299 stop:577 length:279 start_codon:yes stop_codon:yes gene_type:complete